MVGGSSRPPPYSLGVVHLASVLPGWLPQSFSPPDKHSVVVGVEVEVLGEDSVEVDRDSFLGAQRAGESQDGNCS